MKNNYALVSLSILSIFVIAIVFYSLNLESSSFLFLFSCLSVCLASLVVGLLFGFIFGFPHKKYENIDQDKSPMQEITDWLSKIIVGIGLVEFKSIQIQFNNLINSIQEKIGTPESSEVVLGAAILFFLIAGFILSYFLTVTGSIFLRSFSTLGQIQKERLSQQGGREN